MVCFGCLCFVVCVVFIVFGLLVVLYLIGLLCYLVIIVWFVTWFSCFCIAGFWFGDCCCSFELARLCGLKCSLSVGVVFVVRWVCVTGLLFGG